MLSAAGEVQRFFVALIPPDPWFSFFENIKKELEQRFGLRAAQRSPAHITIHRPFVWKIEKKEFLIKSFLRFSFQSFTCRMNGYDVFEKNRVLYARPESNEELHLLYRQFADFAALQWNITTEKKHNRPFHPHITLAFRDVKPDVFNQLKEIFSRRELLADIPFSSLYLLEWKSGKWEPVAELQGL